jgi:hypothetical protein
VVALSVPLALLACVLGHAAGYAIVGASPRDQTLHGYLAYGPLFLAVSITVAAVALGLRIAGRLQGRPSPLPVVLIGPLAFLAQELGERIGAGLPAEAVLDPAVLAGLLAQPPLALLSYALAGWLLRAADVLATALAPMRRAHGPSPPLLVASVGSTSAPQPSHTYAGFARAPPPSPAL